MRCFGVVRTITAVNGPMKEAVQCPPRKCSARDAFDVLLRVGLVAGFFSAGVVTHSSGDFRPEISYFTAPRYRHRTIR